MPELGQRETESAQAEPEPPARCRAGPERPICREGLIFVNLVKKSPSPGPPGADFFETGSTKISPGIPELVIIVKNPQKLVIIIKNPPKLVIIVKNPQKTRHNSQETPKTHHNSQEHSKTGQ